MTLWFRFKENLVAVFWPLLKRIDGFHGILGVLARATYGLFRAHKFC